MASISRRLRKSAQAILSLVIASALFLVPGCGEDPSRMAGTIELPERKVGPPPDAKSFVKDRATPKNPNP
jgi:hypothetical protein